MPTKTAKRRQMEMKGAPNYFATENFPQLKLISSSKESKRRKEKIISYEKSLRCCAIAVQRRKGF